MKKEKVYGTLSFPHFLFKDPKSKKRVRPFVSLAEEIRGQALRHYISPHEKNIIHQLHWNSTGSSTHDQMERHVQLHTKEKQSTIITLICAQIISSHLASLEFLPFHGTEYLLS
jgi:hypothetical protein